MFSDIIGFSRAIDTVKKHYPSQKDRVDKTKQMFEENMPILPNILKDPRVQRAKQQMEEKVASAEKRSEQFK